MLHGAEGTPDEGLRQQELDDVRKGWHEFDRNIPIPVEARKLEQLADDEALVCRRIVVPWPHHAEM